jgi:VWFA-related protein
MADFSVFGARRFLILRAPFLLAPSLTSWLLRAQEADPVISVDTHLVVLQVSVRDAKGHIVPGLGKESFHVREDGRAEAVSLFTNEDVPVAAGLVIDNSGSMRDKISDVTAAAMEFARASNPLDQIFVIHFNEHVKVDPADGGLLASSAVDVEKALDSVAPDGETALYDAIDAGLGRLKKSDRERKVLILISDGGDDASHHRLEEVVQDARASDATIYTIGLFDEKNPDRNPGLLRRLARLTGGEAFLPRTHTEIVEACRKIASDVRAQYTIGYSPSNRALDGRYRNIQLTAVDRAGMRLSVRTRQGYLAPRR